MTESTFVRIACQGCGLNSTIPVEALLVSVAVEDPSCDSIGLAGTDETCADLDDRAATVAWACDSCCDLVTVPIEWPALLTLVAAGAILLDDASDALPPHPERSAGGRPLSRDDLLALHELLTTDSWFDLVTSNGS
jgi:hypothetical protein